MLSPSLHISDARLASRTIGGRAALSGIFSSGAHGVQVLGGRAGSIRARRFQLPVRQPARSALLDWRRGRRKDTPLNWSLTMPNIPGASAPPPARCKVSTASPLTESPPWPLSGWCCSTHSTRRTLPSTRRLSHDLAFLAYRRMLAGLYDAQDALHGDASKLPAAVAAFLATVHRECQQPSPNQFRLHRRRRSLRAVLRRLDDRHQPSGRRSVPRGPAADCCQAGSLHHRGTGDGRPEQRH